MLNEEITKEIFNSDLSGKFLTFWVYDQIFGVPISDVVSIVGIQKISRSLGHPPNIIEYIWKSRHFPSRPYALCIFSFISSVATSSMEERAEPITSKMARSPTSVFITDCEMSRIVCTRSCTLKSHAAGSMIRY